MAITGVSSISIWIAPQQVTGFPTSCKQNSEDNSVVELRTDRGDITYQHHNYTFILRCFIIIEAPNEQDIYSAQVCV